MTEQLQQDAAKLLNETFGKKLESGESIRLEVENNGQEVMLRAYVGTLQRAHFFELKTTPTEADDPEELVLLLIDFLGPSLNTFFRQDRRGGFSLAFTKREFEGTTLWVRQEYRDFEAERMADELLAADAKKLI
jgi:hypothetical protein